MPKPNVVHFVAKANLTPWYPGGVKPVHVGVYERQHAKRAYQTAYSYWNGQHWCLLAKNIHEALENKTIRSCWQEIDWRGLAK
jgi:hypothetical protein